MGHLTLSQLAQIAHHLHASGMGQQPQSTAPVGQAPWEQWAAQAPPPEQAPPRGPGEANPYADYMPGGPKDPYAPNPESDRIQAMHDMLWPGAAQRRRQNLTNKFMQGANPADKYISPTGGAGIGTGNPMTPLARPQAPTWQPEQPSGPPLPPELNPFGKKPPTE